MSVSAAVGRRRLLQLADLLQHLPAHRFDYSSWVGEDWKRKADLSCGTTACALGWATTIPALRRVGLRLVSPKPDHTGYVGLGYVGLVKGNKLVCTTESAAATVFGIDVDEAAYLFTGERVPPFEFESALSISPGWNAKPKEVARHIRRFVKVKFPTSKK